MISGRSRAPGQHTGEDDVHDLDEHALDEGSPGAPDQDEDDDEGHPAGGGLRRRLLAVGLLGVVALVGALLGTLHADARASQAERELRLDTALRTGAVSLDGSSSPSGDLQLATASVPLVNTSGQPVSARLVALEAPHVGRFRLSAGSAGTPVPVTVAPGSALSVQAALEVRCQDVPAQDPYGAPSTEEAEPAAVLVDAAPAPDGDRAQEGRRVRLPLAADEARRLAAELTWACHPDSGPGVPQASYTWLPDGRLRVDLVNGAAPGAPVRITARASGGVSVDSSPQLPLVLQPGGAQELMLTARIDCSAAGDGSQSAVVLSSEEPVDGGAAQGSTAYDISSGSSGDGTPYGTAGWLVRQVALACG